MCAYEDLSFFIGPLAVKPALPYQRHPACHHPAADFEPRQVDTARHLATAVVAPSPDDLVQSGHDRLAEQRRDQAAAEVAPVDPDRSTIEPAAQGTAGLAPEVVEAGHGSLIAEPANARIFFSIYFLMTGLHGIHVLGGMAAMLWLLVKTRRGDFATGHFTPVDMVGLYWHLVDLIWVFLLPLFYLTA